MFAKAQIPAKVKCIPVFWDDGDVYMAAVSQVYWMNTHRMLTLKTER